MSKYKKEDGWQCMSRLSVSSYGAVEFRYKLARFNRNEKRWEGAEEVVEVRYDNLARDNKNAPLSITAADVEFSIASIEARPAALIERLRAHCAKSRNYFDVDGFPGELQAQLSLENWHNGKILVELSVWIDGGWSLHKCVIASYVAHAEPFIATQGWHDDGKTKWERREDMY